LDHALDNFMLNAGVFSLSVLADQDGVDVVVRGLIAGD
jgi:hypothetical protein